MKKLTLFAIFGLMTVAANAAVEPTGTVVTTTCNKQVMTVPSTFFNDINEYQAYLKDLNKIYCGSEHMPKEVADRY